jgi:ribonucleotide reductase beta subunit family protein with ferritin-like domain
MAQYAVFPIRDPESWRLYKKAQEQPWVDEEINENLARDTHDWPKLEPRIQHLIKRVLAFFAISDGLVNENIAVHLAPQFNSREIAMWYNHQAANEDVHNTVYSRLVETYVKDVKEREAMLDAAAHYPTIGRKVEWIRNQMMPHAELTPLLDLPLTVRNMLERLCANAWDNTPLQTSPVERDLLTDIVDTICDGRPSLAQQVFVNAVVEGIFFSGSFCVIFWVRHFYGLLPGLATANEWISRDEASHTNFAVHLYRNRIGAKLSDKQAMRIIDEAVELEYEFIKDALPEGLNGMNADMMHQYIRFVADQLLTLMGHPPKYGATCPFQFMIKQSIGVRITDFFETSEVAEYGEKNVGLTKEDKEFTFDYD